MTVPQPMAAATLLDIATLMDITTHPGSPAPEVEVEGSGLVRLLEASSAIYLVTGETQDTTTISSHMLGLPGPVAGVQAGEMVAPPGHLHVPWEVGRLAQAPEQHQVLYKLFLLIFSVKCLMKSCKINHYSFIKMLFVIRNSTVQNMIHRYQLENSYFQSINNCHYNLYHISYEFLSPYFRIWWH